MTEDDKLHKIRTALIDYNLGDIKYLLQGKKLIAGFILAGCFIDHLTCFRYGRDGTASLYRQFVKEYLQIYGYNPESIYKDLRCKLVHSYSVSQNSYGLTINTPNLHLKTWEFGKKMLNLNNFVDDLEEVCCKYLNELGTDKAIRDLAIKRFDTAGILQHQQLT